MKNTSVTPSATFDQMPSPSHSVEIGYRGDARLAREPEADHDAAKRADRERENRLPQGDQQMFPDHAASKPVEDLAADVHRIGKEERRQQHAPENRHSGEQLPQRERDDGDQKLTEKQ